MNNNKNKNTIQQSQFYPCRQAKIEWFLNEISEIMTGEHMLYLYYFFKCTSSQSKTTLKKIKENELRDITIKFVRAEKQKVLSGWRLKISKDYASSNGDPETKNYTARNTQELETPTSWELGSMGGFENRRIHLKSIQEAVAP